MELLKQRIRQDGVVKGSDVLKVDSFLNHQMDVALFAEIGKEFHRLFGDCGVNKILTIEASGIGIACVTAQFFHCPVLFAKKSQSRNLSAEVYATKVESFTHGRVYDVIVSKQYLGPEDKVLIIDDFLANGAALEGLMDLVHQAGAQLVGAGIVIEKAFQPGGARIRGKGVRVESLAQVKSMSEEAGIEFVDDPQKIG
jgi:xanthine phosphoribosyltransferase